MKTLNKKNQHEIGFDIECLPAWANYIAMNPNGRWFLSTLYPKNEKNLYWHLRGSISVIPPKYEPSEFTDNWINSLYKIER